jgi:hypothetical protein
MAETKKASNIGLRKAALICNKPPDQRLEFIDLAGADLGKSALDERVLAAMGRVPRHAFVPPPLARHAYQDMPLPIGFDKTISQPFIVAIMTDLLEPQPHDVVLEIGTGLGYQAAVLGQLVRRVWSVEIIEELAVQAEARLRRLGYDNIGIHIGDGSLGWAEHAPYERSSSRRPSSWCLQPCCSSSGPEAGWCYRPGWPRIRS